MEIDGTICANLLAAIASARRWSGRPVHDDTLRHWDELLAHARRVSSERHDENLLERIAEFEALLAARGPAS